jgi:hypothetical protein
VLSQKLYKFKRNDPLKIMLTREGLEPITDELIEELKSETLPKSALLQLQAEGYEYCKARHSFFGPPEVF